MKELKVVTAGLHRLAQGIDTRSPQDGAGDSLASLVEASEGALAEAEQARRALLAQHRRELSAADVSIGKIRAALRALRAQRRKDDRTTKVRPANIQAGKAAIQAVTDRISSGPISQKQVVADTGLNVGTVSYAIKALMQAGAVELTGRSIEGSRELRMVRGQSAVARALYARAREVVAETKPVRA